MTKAIEDTDFGVVTHPRQSRRHPAKILNDLDFADNIALLESCIPSAQAQLPEQLPQQNSLASLSVFPGPST